nr:hypothetical protein [uncultured Allomuricauda sp.]
MEFYDLPKDERSLLVEKALDEIVDVHDRYKNFSVLTQKEAITYIDKNYT